MKEVTIIQHGKDGFTVKWKSADSGEEKTKHFNQVHLLPHFLMELELNCQMRREQVTIKKVGW